MAIAAAPRLGSIVARLSVMLGLPTMTNRLTVQIAGLIESLRLSACDAEADFHFEVTYKHGYHPVEYARNAIVGDFLRSNCQKLWFMDEDMLPHHSAARLLHSPFDITCAQMYRFDHPNEEKQMTVGLGLCAMTRNQNGLYRPLMPVPGCDIVQEVDAVGTGCTVIARHVLEDRRMWRDNVYRKVTGEEIDGNVDTGDGEFAPAVFSFLRAPNGAGLMGEDVDFSKRAKELGYTVAVDLLARCGHYKQIDIDEAGNLATETVKRVVRGIKSEDGRVFRFALQEPDGNEEKALGGPPMDKMLRAHDLPRKAM